MDMRSLLNSLCSSKHSEKMCQIVTKIIADFEDNHY